MVTIPGLNITIGGPSKERGLSIALPKSKVRIVSTRRSDLGRVIHRPGLVRGRFGIKSK